jgi:hypothetical protein
VHLRMPQAVRTLKTLCTIVLLPTNATRHSSQ